MQSFKQDRIAQILCEEINTMIVMQKIKDPRVSSRVSVLHVDVAKDTTSATVYISSFLEEQTLDRCVVALNHAKGFIQSEIAKRHKWRNTPRLYFKASTGLQSGERILETLKATPHEVQENLSLEKPEEKSSDKPEEQN